MLMTFRLLNLTGAVRGVLSRCWLLYASFMLCLLATADPGNDNAADMFEREVRPILAKHCFDCHGSEKQKSELRLDSALSIRSGGTRGPAVDPGNTDSLLLQAIRQTGELKMPPDGQLEPSEIDELTRWVEAGANWPEYEANQILPEVGLIEARAKHWAYQPLSQAAPPEVANEVWNRNGIDRFLWRALEEAELQPSPQADKRTLIRRVTYDLTGLPPAPEEVDAFLADSRPDAFEALVERLLASPRYGERWARHWLDAVRYTDSFDSRANDKTDVVEIWRYRDWVVNAMNTDMPYDRFVAYQVSGDVMPLADGAFNRDGLIATGMLAMGNWPQGDADKEKMVTDIVDDQVDVVMRTFLGVTMACARCHDHKFDPFSTEEYYGLAGIFFSSSILPGPGMKTEGSPILHLPLAFPEILAQRAASEERLAKLHEEREALLTQARTEFSMQHIGQTDLYLLAAYHEDSATPPQADPALNVDALRNWTRTLNDDIIPALQRVESDFQQLPGLFSRNDADSTPSAVGNTTETEVKYSTITQPGRSVVVHPGPQEGVGIGWRAPVDAFVTLSGHLADADANCGDGIQWSVVHRESGVERVIATGQIANGGTSPLGVDTPFSIERGGQVLLTVMPGGGHACDTTQVALQITSDAGQVWDLATDVLPRFAEGNPWPDDSGNPDVWWLYREAGKPELDPVLFAPWWTALREVREGRRDADALREAAAVIQSAIDSALANSESPLRTAVDQLTGPGGPMWLASPPTEDDSRLARLDAEIAEINHQLESPIDYAIGIQEGGVPGTGHAGIHDVHVHHRGDYAKLGALVPRQMPAIITGASPRTVTQGSGRRDLGEWLTDDCAALLARVMVNRVWQHHFGRGLVRTPGDFGAQGIPPTHPELLDYLAARFIESGWSIKDLHRAMVNTAVYKQSSAATDRHVEVDPDNRLLAHMNRRRLDAEALRDSLMAVTGRLDPTLGGPAYTDVSTPRRTLYLRTVRSNLNTYVVLFDGADPTAITPTRNESTVAPQALFFMNHPLFLSAADALVAQIDYGQTPNPVEEMYRRVFARMPTETELQIAESALQRLGYPESSTALTAYAQILLSCNEFYFID